jgi:hypothetical protein
MGFSSKQFIDFETVSRDRFMIKKQCKNLLSNLLLYDISHLFFIFSLLDTSICNVHAVFMHFIRAIFYMIPIIKKLLSHFCRSSLSTQLKKEIINVLYKSSYTGYTLIMSDMYVNCAKTLKHLGKLIYHRAKLAEFCFIAILVKFLSFLAKTFLFTCKMVDKVASNFCQAMQGFAMEEKINVGWKNEVAIMFLCYGLPLICLNMLLVIMLLVNRKRQEFSSSFYALFIVATILVCSEKWKLTGKGGGEFGP